MSKRKNNIEAGEPLDNEVENHKAQETAHEETAHAFTSEPEAEPSLNKLTPVGKLTVATVFGKISMADLPLLQTGTIEAPIDNPNKELKICRIAGFASGVKDGVSSYGPWAALVGEFAATNHETGEIFASKTALIPGAMGEMLVSSVNDMVAKNPGGKLRFSVDVSVSRSPREPDKKYVYIVRPVLEAALGSPAIALLTMG